MLFPERYKEEARIMAVSVFDDLNRATDADVEELKARIGYDPDRTDNDPAARALRHLLRARTAAQQASDIGNAATDVAPAPLP